MIPLQTAFPHPVTHLVFSQDGSAVAVAQPHSGVTIIDRATGQTLAVCAMPRRAQLTGLTFSGNGKYVAAASARGLEVFDANTGERLWGSRHSMHLCLELVDRDGDLLGANAHQGYTVWELTGSNGSGAPPCRRAGRHTFRALSENGHYGVAVYKDSLIDLATDRVIVVAEERSGRPTHPRGLEVQLCPLGHRFALNDGLAIDVYDASGLSETESEDEQHTDTLPVQRANGTQAAVAPMPHAVLPPTFTLKPDKSVKSLWYPPFALAADGRGLLVKRPRNRIQWWDTPTGTLMNEWSWRFEWVTCVAVSADGLTAVAGGRFGRVLLWDLE